MPDADVTIRPAGLDDVAGAARLAAELVRFHHRLDPPRFMCIEPLEEGYRSFLRSQVGRASTVFLVAVDGSDVVGYVLGGLEGRDWMDLRDACGKLHDVYVDPPARGRGIARRLLEEACARLERMGVPRIVLMTAWANPDAHRLFERLGFRRTMLEMTREAREP